MLVKVVAGVHARCGVGGATVVVLCLGGDGALLFRRGRDYSIDKLEPIKSIITFICNVLTQPYTLPSLLFLLFPSSPASLPPSCLQKSKKSKTAKSAKESVTPSAPPPSPPTLTCALGVEYSLSIRGSTCGEEWAPVWELERCEDAMRSLKPNQGELALEYDEGFHTDPPCYYWIGATTGTSQVIWHNSYSSDVENTHGDVQVACYKCRTIATEGAAVAEQPGSTTSSTTTTTITTTTTTTTTSTPEPQRQPTRRPARPVPTPTPAPPPATRATPRPVLLTESPCANVDADRHCNGFGTLVVRSGECRCKCDDGRTGASCESTPCTGKTAATTCNGFGSLAVKGRVCGCDCDAGHKGKQCQVTPCTGKRESAWCNGAGTLSVKGETCGCDCVEGFAGAYCDVDLGATLVMAQADTTSSSTTVAPTTTTTTTTTATITTTTTSTAAAAAAVTTTTDAPTTAPFMSKNAGSKQTIVGGDDNTGADDAGAKTGVQSAAPPPELDSVSLLFSHEDLYYLNLNSTSIR